MIHTAKRWNNPRRYDDSDLLEKPTAFELEAERLGVPESQWAESFKLRQWARKNRNFRYVPSVLMKRWGIDTIFDWEGWQ